MEIFGLTEFKTNDIVCVGLKDIHVCAMFYVTEVYQRNTCKFHCAYREELLNGLVWNTFNLWDKLFCFCSSVPIWTANNVVAHFMKLVLSPFLDVNDTRSRPLYVRNKYLFALAAVAVLQLSLITGLHTTPLMFILRVYRISSTFVEQRLFQALYPKIGGHILKPE